MGLVEEGLPNDPEKRQVGDGRYWSSGCPGSEGRAHFTRAEGVRRLKLWRSQVK